MAHGSSWPNTLREIGLFRDCSRPELRRAAGLLTAVEVPRGETLVREGRHGQQFMLLVSGCAEVTMGEGAAQRRVALLGPGDLIGELSLLEGSVRSATVTALTDVTVYASNTREFAALLDIPSVGAKIRAVAAERRAVNQSAAA